MLSISIKRVERRVYERKCPTGLRHRDKAHLTNLLSVLPELGVEFRPYVDCISVTHSLCSGGGNRRKIKVHYAEKTRYNANSRYQREKRTVVAEVTGSRPEEVGRGATPVATIDVSRCRIATFKPIRWPVMETVMRLCRAFAAFRSRAPVSQLSS